MIWVLWGGFFLDWIVRPLVDALFGYRVYSSSEVGHLCATEFLRAAPLVSVFLADSSNLPFPFNAVVELIHLVARWWPF